MLRASRQAAGALPWTGGCAHLASRACQPLRHPRHPARGSLRSHPALAALGCSSRAVSRPHRASACSAEGSGGSSSGPSSSSPPPTEGGGAPEGSGSGEGGDSPSPSCSNTSSSSGPPLPQKRPPVPQRRPGPFWGFLGRLNIREPFRLAFNAAALLLLMRFWGPRLEAPGGNIVEVRP